MTTTTDLPLVYGISRWTSANRGAALHIDNGHGLPLCGGAGRKAFTWERTTGKPTCKRCIQMAAKAERETNTTGKVA